MRPIEQQRALYNEFSYFWPSVRKWLKPPVF